MLDITETAINETDVLSPQLLKKLHAYWRAANYLLVGQLYLRNNPLLTEPLKLNISKICF